MNAGLIKDETKNYNLNKRRSMRLYAGIALIISGAVTIIIQYLT